MKKTLALLLFIFMLVVGFVGCADTDHEASNDSGNESDISGRITKEVGSMADYIGWWHLEDDVEAAPFTCVEISKDNAGEVRCYDKKGGMIDTGYTDYNEQRALNGNSLIVFSFGNIGEFGATAAISTNEERWLDIKVGDMTLTFHYQNESPFETEKPIDILSTVLGNKLNGKKLVEKGEEIIGGVTCNIFSLGTDHPENFVAEEHFAVSPNGDVYTIDVLQGAEWIPYIQKLN